MYKKIEESIALKVARFLKIQYPNINYRFDVGADINLSIGQASKFKALQMNKRGYPDLFIAKPSKGYHGLYIEVKKDTIIERTVLSDLKDFDLSKYKIRNKQQVIRNQVNYTVGKHILECALNVKRIDETINLFNFDKVI